jgi:predicted small lipoprotein YifL
MNFPKKFKMELRCGFILFVVNPMRALLIILALGLGLQACGLKGPLVLPAPAAQSAPSGQTNPASPSDAARDIKK